MSEQIATFFNAKIGTANYLFLVTNNSAFDIEIRKALWRSVSKFGIAVGEKARISTIHDGSAKRAHDELLRKIWPDQVREALASHQSPFLVLIKVDFEAFDPEVHEWFIIWLSALGRPRKAVPLLFDRLAREIAAGCNLTEFLNRAIATPAGLFKEGTIWSRQHFHGLPTPPRAGRTAIVRPELLRVLDRILMSKRYYAEDWRTWHANWAQKWLDDNGERYLVKSVYDALGRQKWFGYAEQVLKNDGPYAFYRYPGEDN
jgi:hypothetical protein